MGGRGNNPSDSLSEPLTRREREILALLAQELSNQEIAQQLSLAVGSTKWHIQQIYGKLGVNSRRQAIARAQELGWLPSAPGRSETRPAGPLPTGTVTFLFTDIEGSSPLWERSPRQMSAALLIHHAALRRAIEDHAGVVFKTVGDAFQAAFPTAPQALAAAIAGQQTLRSAPWNELGPLRVRMGLHTGEAELDPGGDEYAVSHTKNRAARIMSTGHGGQILLSAETAELVNHQLPPGISLRDLGEHQLKGLLLPERIYQAVSPDQPAEFPALASLTRPQHNLPLELTSFIGRQREIAQVMELLRQHRLVTLTGSGGVGKTRLSIQVAGQMLGEFKHGVWYVELAPISDPALVPQALAGAVGVREETNRPLVDTLVAFLHKRELLVVLDNCEHLLEACARLADALLHKAPGLCILASSREALGIAGEYAFHVPSLSIPDPRQFTFPEALQEYEAVQMFAERARVVLPDFTIRPENAQAVAAICQRLDGIPLALELAASRLNLLTSEQLASRLDQAFRLLTGGSRTALPRQQTLRAAIDWSYRLLSDPEKVLLRRLAVFAGGCTLEAAEAVCADEQVKAADILDLLGGLVNKSMVDVDRKPQAEARYHLLETVRQYAREKLYDSGESELLRNRHLDDYEAWMQAALPHLHGAERAEWTRRLKREYDNLREALEWSFQDPVLAIQGLRIATALTLRFWLVTGLYREAWSWLNAGLQAAGEGIPRLLKAEVFFSLTHFQPDTVAPETYFNRCIDLCREIGPEADRVLCGVLRHSWHLGNFQEALPRVEESVRLARAMGPAGSWDLGESLFFYALVLYMHSEGAYDDQALAAAQEALQINQAGDRWNVPAYWIIGFIQAHRGQEEQARQTFEKALAVFSETDDFIGLLYTSFDLARIHRLAGRYELARQACQRLFQTVDAVADRYGYALFVYSIGMLQVNRLNDPLSKEDPQTGLEAVRLLGSQEKLWQGDWVWYGRMYREDQKEIAWLRQRIGEEVFSRSWQEGRAMPLEQAVKVAGSISFEDE